jgi:uncharacterized protein (TIGR03435 family)
MTVAKAGLKMTPGTAPEASTCSRREGPENVAHADCTMAMPDLAKNLRRMAPAYFDRDVIDQTGLAGSWNLQLSWVAKNLTDDAGGATIFEALEKQAGLKLDLRKVPMPMVVIDGIEKPQNIQ